MISFAKEHRMRGGVWIVAAGGIVGLILSIGAAQENPFGEYGAVIGKSGEQSSSSQAQSRFFSRGDDSRSSSQNAAGTRDNNELEDANGFLPGSHRTGLLESGSVGSRKSFRLSNQNDVPAPSRYTRSQNTTFERPKPIPDNFDVPPVQNYLRDLFSEHRFSDRKATQPRTARPAPTGAQPRPAGFNKLLPPDNQTVLTPVPAVPHAAEANAEQNPPAGSAGGLRYADFERPAGEREQDVIRQVRVTDENVSPIAAADGNGEPATDADAATGQGASKPAAARLPLPIAREPDSQSPAPTAEPPAPSGHPTAPPESKTTVSLPTNMLAPAAAATALRAVPAGPQTPMITVHWIKQSDVNVGQECQCQLHVTNSGDVSAKNVAVDAFFPSSVRITETSPAPAESSDHLTWRFRELAPGEKQVLGIHMIPTQQGEVTTTAFVTFTAAASGLFHVTEPLLAIDVEGPEKVLIGDPAAQVIRVSNPGTGIATNVTLEALVPKGLEHPRGERLSMEIGSLNPGETRVVRLALASIGGGEQMLHVQVAGDGGLQQIEEKTISVIEPSLSATITGPETRYVGHAARYTLAVTNNGGVASNNVRALYQVPKGFTFLRSEEGGRFDPIRGTVSWYVGRLAPNESIERTIFLTAAGEGRFTHTAAATSEHGATAETKLVTNIEGTASLAVEIVERDDPVQLGVETAFEVRVQNDGSKPALSVGLSIELPAGVKYQSARGPSEHIATGGLLVFKSIDRLDPGKTAVYRVYILGTAAGNHRIRARVASESIGEPLISEELTNFIGQ